MDKRVRNPGPVAAQRLRLHLAQGWLALVLYLLHMHIRKIHMLPALTRQQHLQGRHVVYVR